MCRYDFGGQLVFYPTHQFFLTARSMYLVVFNVTNEDLHNVRYWIKQIRASTQGIYANAPLSVPRTHRLTGALAGSQEWRRPCSSLVHTSIPTSATAPSFMIWVVRSAGVSPSQSGLP